jgi:predicted RNA polymerase sigma factor
LWGHSRRGRAASKPGYIRYASEAEVNSEHQRRREARAAFEAAAALAGNKREQELLKRRATEAGNAAAV